MRLVTDAAICSSYHLSASWQDAAGQIYSENMLPVDILSDL